MASTEETLTCHVTMAVTLLEIFKFVVNYQKSLLNPTQLIEFLGFRINSVMLNISLPLDKVKSIRRECRKVLENPDITIRELARLLGKLSASIQAVFPAPIHYCYIQTVKNRSLTLHGGYESPVCWTEEALEELKWWRPPFCLERESNLRNPSSHDNRNRCFHKSHKATHKLLRTAAVLP